MLLCIFPGVLWLWHFLYSVGQHPVSSLHIYTFVVSRAFMAGAASEAGDADSSRAPGLTSGLQRSVNVHRGALLLVSQWQCISSFVFYIIDFTKNNRTHQGRVPIQSEAESAGEQTWRMESVKEDGYRNQEVTENWNLFIYINTSKRTYGSFCSF